MTNGSVAAGDTPAITNLELQSDYRNGVLDVTQLAASVEGARVTGSGRIPARIFPDVIPRAHLTTLSDPLDRATFAAAIDSITPATLARFVDPETLSQIQGTVSAAVRLEATTASWAGLSGDVSLTQSKVVVAGVPLTELRPTRLTFTEGVLRIVDLEWQAGDARIAARGSVSLEGDQPLDVSVDGNLDLRMLGALLPGSAMAGRAELHARGSGTLGSPLLDGEAVVMNGEWRLTEPRLAATGLNGRLSFSADRIRIDGVTGRLNGGDLQISGDVRHAGLALTDGALSITSTGASVEFPRGLRSEVNAELTVEIVQSEIVVDGALSIERGAYRNPLRLTEELLTAARTRSLAAGTSAPASLLGAVRLEIAMRTENDILVDNNYARLSLGSDLRIVGTLAAPSIVGRATIREGGILTLAGRAYRIQTGSIDFSNPVEIEPDLNVQARTRVRDYDITLTLSGTPAQLETQLTSDPPLGQSDLVSLLVTGRTPTSQTAQRAKCRRIRCSAICLASSSGLPAARSASTSCAWSVEWASRISARIRASSRASWIRERA